MRGIVRIEMVCDHYFQPKRMSIHDIGYDLRTTKDIRLSVGESCKVGLGVRFGIPEGYYGELTNRSSLAFKQGVICNHGIIDSSFTGEVHAYLFNLSQTYQWFSKGDRICQIIFKRQVVTGLIEVSELTEGKAGFGSSGRN